MIKILFFASLRESLGVAEEMFDLPSEEYEVSVLRKRLSERGGAWQNALKQEKNLMVAVNQTMVDSNHLLKDGDEVAFFPPVTGG